MSKSSSTTLPPCPTLPDSFSGRSNKFAKLDGIIEALIERRPLTTRALKLIKLSGLEKPIYYVRRSVFMAGIDAWKRASAWEARKPAIRERLEHLKETVEQIRRGGRELGDISKMITSSPPPKLADPTIIRRAIVDRQMAEDLDHSAEWIGLLDENFDRIVAECERLDIGRRDALTGYYVENGANLWVKLFDTMPATARTGPFVAFADEGWDLLGWNSHSSRSTLGKAIFEKASSEHWSRLSRAISRPTGTRLAK